MPRLRSRVLRLEKRANPDGLIWAVNSEEELAKLLEQNPEARSNTILIVAPIKKPSNPGLSCTSKP